MVLIGSYDGSLYALGAADGKLRWTFATENYVHGVALRSWTASRTSPAATRCSTRCASPTARRRSPTSATAYTGASVGIVDGVAYFGTFDNQVVALDLARRP